VSLLRTFTSVVKRECRSTLPGQIAARELENRLGALHRAEELSDDVFAATEGLSEE
jgi:hypothetical protein